MKELELNWIIHLVYDDIGEGGMTNSHTHGMEQYGHPDFQVVLPFPTEHIGYLLNTMGLRVQMGERFKDGDLVQGLYEDCSVRVSEFIETGRTVLRLIIPDKHNRFPEDPECDDRYKIQINRYFEE